MATHSCCHVAVIGAAAAAVAEIVFKQPAFSMA
jgi:hypothetical protein